MTICYRSAAFSRAKPKNRDKVRALVDNGRMNAMMNSNVREIREDAVIIDGEDGATILPNQSIIVCAGGILPTGFLKEVGIDVETKYGTA